MFRVARVGPNRDSSVSAAVARVAGVRATRRAARITRVTSTVASNRLRARTFAAECAADPRGADAELAVFFADGPENLYQVEQWTRLVEQLPYDPAVIVSRPDTGRLLRRTTSLPLVFAPGSAHLERYVDRGRLRVVLYVNHLDLNFRMLRFPGPVHVHLGHGESDKDSSATNQNKAYDLVLVAGPAATERVARRLRGFDVDGHVREIGRPQLDLAYAGAPAWPDDGTVRVLYAPTWEGDRPSMAYGSVASHGVALARALAHDTHYRVVYRPHPRAGYSSAVYADADRAVREVLGSAGPRHLVDTGAYGWQWAFADVCITDVSSVAYDWLATGKPLLVTTPTDPRAVVPPSRLLDQTPRLAVGDLTSLPERLGATPPDPALTRYYFGETADRASTARFDAAIAEASALALR